MELLLLLLLLLVVVVVVVLLLLLLGCCLGRRTPRPLLWFEGAEPRVRCRRPRHRPRHPLCWAPRRRLAQAAAASRSARPGRW